MINFTIYGNPVPKGRHRSTRSGHSYTPQRTRDYEARVADAAMMANVRPLTGDVSLTVVFYRGSAHRCDLDNLVKAVSDGINGIAFVDDVQVVELHAMKQLDRDNPRAEVTVEAV